LQAVGDLTQADFRSFFGTRRMLEKRLNQELLIVVEKRIVNGGTAKIDSRDYEHAVTPRCEFDPDSPR
jgi:hypothetical protein